MLAAASDLRVFFTVDKEPAELTVDDVLSFITAQRRSTLEIVRIKDSEAGLTSATIKRRLSLVSGCSVTW